MKNFKIFLMTVALLFIVSPAFSETTTATTTTTATATSTTNWDSAANLERINRIGTKLLTENNLPKGITFKLSTDEDINAYANINKEVYIYKGLLQYVDYDHELAAVIAHELGHIVNGHCAKQTLLNACITTIANSINKPDSVAVAFGQQYASSKLSRTDEMEADLMAVDLLIKADYNPLALISVLNKICGNYIDILETHPSGEKRLMNIYDYIAYNYPTYVKTVYNTPSYKNALSFINANVNYRNSNKKALKKYEKTQAKLKAKKIKRAEKMHNAVNGWDASYTVLQLMAE